MRWPKIPTRCWACRARHPDEEIRRPTANWRRNCIPDLNPANKASAEERFKKVSAAYDIVGDPEKRKQYDRGEIDANGEQRREAINAPTPVAAPLAGRSRRRPSRR